MDYKASDIAKFVVNHADELGMNVSNMKLQKILYYLQGFSYSIFGEQLFCDEIEAWPYGPVVRGVYIDFNIFGSDKIPAYNDVLEFVFSFEDEEENREIKDYVSIFSEDVKAFLYRYTDRLLEFSASDLVASTHADGTPWASIFESNRKNIIPKKTIRNYFEALSHE